MASLDEDLNQLGSRLLRFRATESVSALSAIVKDLEADAVFFNHLYDPISMVRDNEVKGALHAMGITCTSFTGDVLLEPWELIDEKGQPFSCFDDFWEAHKSQAVPDPLPPPPALPPISPSLSASGHTNLEIMTPEEEMSNAQLEYHWSPGSTSARQALEVFVKSGRLEKFTKDRAKTDRNSTSRLSPHIHFGEVSVRRIYSETKKATFEWDEKRSSTAAVHEFLRQLGFREYSRYLSFHFPFTHERSLLEHLRAVPWRMDQALFKAWRTGTTGYPLVDAGMREIWSTGWMHNRIRVVAASFMVKNLLLPWQWGLKHYWDALLDADLECDALGWQYCAGCLEDAHPFSYFIDLKEESKRFDPDGNYVRRWLPVLARLPKQYIHAPWDAPPEILADAGVELGLNYPFPVIDMEESISALGAAAEVVESVAAEAAVANSDSGNRIVILDGGQTTTVSSGNTCRSRGPFRQATYPVPFAATKVWGNKASVLPEQSTQRSSAPCGRAEQVEEKYIADKKKDNKEREREEVESNGIVEAALVKPGGINYHGSNHGSSTIGNIPVLSKTGHPAQKLDEEKVIDGPEAKRYKFSPASTF